MWLTPAHLSTSSPRHDARALTTSRRDRHGNRRLCPSGASATETFPAPQIVALRVPAAKDDSNGSVANVEGLKRDFQSPAPRKPEWAGTSGSNRGPAITL